MIRKPTILFTAILLSAPVAVAGVDVRFVAPERYSESDFSFASARNAAFDALRRHIERLGAQHLKHGQDLTIDVLDIDLAGQYEPWHPRLANVRIYRDVTPPRLKLRFVLREKGKSILSGEETLSDMMYQWNYSARHSSDPYRYEKALLNDWFDRRFPAQR